MKKLAGIWLSLLMVFGLIAGCSTTNHQSEPLKKQTSTTQAFPVSIHDASNKTVTINKEPKRIVSLMPSNTEIVYALGLGKKVVGVTTNDTYPKEVKNIEKVGNMNVNVEKVISLNPDLVLAHASAMQGSEDALKQIEDAKIPVVTVNDAQSFAGVYQSIRMIGKATGTQKKATSLIKKMKSDLHGVKEKAKNISKDKEKSVFVEVSSAPSIYTTGKNTFMDEMLKTIHAKNAASQQKGWVQMTDEAIVKLNPDVIITTDGATLKDVKKRSGWKELKAVKNKQVYAVDPDLVNRPGPRLIEGVKEIAKSVYPETFKK